MKLQSNCWLNFRNTQSMCKMLCTFLPQIWFDEISISFWLIECTQDLKAISYVLKVSFVAKMNQRIH